MKLIVQIPVLNEAESIARVLADIPRTIPGIVTVEVLIIDDGCTDDTIAVALAHGADHVVRHTSRKGLATAYQTGIDTALRLGADIIVNTDGDNQYPGHEIPRLVAPILAGQADLVIGDRQIESNVHFSPFKKALQALGSSVVRWASGTNVPDTVSGFRALSREAALRTFVTSDFSYTVENIIQAGKRRLTICTVPIVTNRVQRESRLHTGNWNFIKRQASTIVRTYTAYEPLKTFSYIAAPFLIAGIVFLGRALYVYLMRQLVDNFPQDNTQSLAIGGTALIIGFVVFLIGLLADRIGGTRRLLEEVLYRVRSQEIADQAWRREVQAYLERIEHDLSTRSNAGTDETGSTYHELEAEKHELRLGN
ncbi:MAG: glycosyltransferase family 2 protein [Chloroflexi bacterium]|nr:glycosyltransferase family 2 protein [Chloroflexota bacterium]